MAYLTKEQVAEIVRNAPDKSSVINDLLRAGHELQGYNEIAKSFRPEQPGFVKSVVRGIVNPVARAAYTGYKALAGTVDLAQAGIAAARGDEEGASAQLAQAEARTGKSLNVPYLGEIKALGETGSLIGDTKEAVGVGLEIASNIPLARGASTVAKAGFKGLIKEGVKQGAKEGFVGGLLYGAGSGMEEDLTPFEIMTQSAVSAVAGTVFGGAIGGLLGGAGAAASKIKMLKNPVLKKQYIAQQEEKIADIIGDSLNLTKAQRKMQLRSGKDTALFMAREGLPIRVEKGKLVADEALDVIQRKATAENAAFESLLLDDGGFIPFSKVKDYAKSLVDDVGQARNLATRHIDNEILALERQFKKTGFVQDGVTFIPKIVANRLKKKMWEAGKFRLLQTPADQTRAGASRMIGNAFKRLIEETSDDVNIKAFNSRLGDLAEATFMLSERNGSPVKGGKLGKYFARTIGGIVGAPGGTPGSIVGVITGDKLADLMQDPNIKTWAIRQVLSRLKKEGKESLIDEAEGIIARRAVERASRLKLQAPAALGTARNPIIARPPTSFEPAAKQVIKNVTDETADALRKQRGAISVAPEGALTTKVLQKLEGRETVSRQFIEDLTNSGELRQAERDLIRKTLAEYSDSPLAAEARKYKSAEEFVKAQTPVAQYTDNPEGGKFWTTPEGADSGFGSIRKDAYIDTPKLYNKNENSMEFLQNRGLWTKTDPALKKKYGIDTYEQMWEGSQGDEAIGNQFFKKEFGDNPNIPYKILQDKAEEILKAEGYPGAKWINEDDLNPTQYQIWDKSVIKTKSQLTDLYQQAKKGTDINVKEFSDKVKTELLPLEIKNVGKLKTDSNGMPSRFGGRYEGVSLPSELRGDVQNYSERIYQSPIKTSAGDTHYPNEGADSYFAHTRIEDLPSKPISDDWARNGRGVLENKKTGKEITTTEARALNQDKGSTRRVIEIQSDLFQKGRLEAEKSSVVYSGKNKIKEANAARDAELSKLEPYRNTWHERVIREEIKQAAIDGKTALQFPTGETAMKIEGLGDDGGRWFMRSSGERFGKNLEIADLKVGKVVQQDAMGTDYVITDVLGDGKFKAVPKDSVFSKPKQGDGYVGLGASGEKIEFGHKDFIEKAKNSNLTEEFDISGKVDSNNPIFKFYEKDVQKFLNKFGGKKITDTQGVSWIEIPITKEMGKAPIQAFGKTSVGALQVGGAVAVTLAVAPLIAGAIQKVAQGLDARSEAAKLVSEQIGSGSVMGQEAYNEAVGIVKYLLQNGNAQELEKFISDQQLGMKE